MAATESQAGTTAMMAATVLVSQADHDEGSSKHAAMPLLTAVETIETMAAALLPAAAALVFPDALLPAVALLPVVTSAAAAVVLVLPAAAAVQAAVLTSAAAAAVALLTPNRAVEGGSLEPAPVPPAPSRPNGRFIIDSDGATPVVNDDGTAALARARATGPRLSSARKLLSDNALLTDVSATLAATADTIEARITGTLTINASVAETVMANQGSGIRMPGLLGSSLAFISLTNQLS